MRQVLIKNRASKKNWYRFKFSSAHVNSERGRSCRRNEKLTGRARFVSHPLTNPATFHPSRKIHQPDLINHKTVDHARVQLSASMVSPSKQNINCREDSDSTMTTVVDRLCTDNSRNATSTLEDLMGESFNLDESNDTQYFPLHLALANFSLLAFSNPEVAKLMEQKIHNTIRSRPDLGNDFDTDGMNPLHVACIEGSSLAVIEEMITTNDNLVRILTRNKRRMLPLHLVCRYYCGPVATMCAIVQRLLVLYPEAASRTTGLGELALHLCCQNLFCTVRLLKLVVPAYPGALKLGTHKKRQLPLHLACQRHYFQRLRSKHSKNKDLEASCSSDDLIRFLVGFDRETVTYFDARGELPIHTAVRGYQLPTTLKFLLSVFPEAIQFLEGSGRSALHICAGNAEPDLATLFFLLNADPTATDTFDNRQMTPVHYAAASGNVDFIYTLLRSSPASVEALRAASR